MLNMEALGSRVQGCVSFCKLQGLGLRVVSDMQTA